MLFGLEVEMGSASVFEEVTRALQKGHLIMKTGTCGTNP